METCRDCPQQYPWLGDSEGTGIPNRDTYIYGNGNESGADGEQGEAVEESRKK